MRILELRAENLKKITVVAITPKKRMVEISGRNGAGKTSVLDSIWWALGGESNIQDAPIRAGQTSARVELKLGDDVGTTYIVERKFTEKGTYLYVTTADGARYNKDPQTILNDLVGKLTFDPHKFMRDKPAAQLETLRALVKIDVGTMDAQIAAESERRLEIGRKAEWNPHYLARVKELRQ